MFIRSAGVPKRVYVMKPFFFQNFRVRLDIDRKNRIGANFADTKYTDGLRIATGANFADTKTTFWIATYVPNYRFVKS